MSELRHLFALMVSSQRKYVDPSKAVDILKEAFAATAATGVGDSQQVNNRLWFLLQVFVITNRCGVLLLVWETSSNSLFVTILEWNLCIFV